MKRPSIREHFEEMLSDIRNLQEQAEYGNEAQESIFVYYQPIETAARNLAEATLKHHGLTADNQSVYVPLDVFNALLDALQMPGYGEK